MSDFEKKGKNWEEKFAQKKRQLPIWKAAPTCYNLTSNNFLFSTNMFEISPIICRIFG